MNLSDIPQTPRQLLSEHYSLTAIAVFFHGEPVSEPATPFESAVLDSIRLNNSGLLLYRNDGLFRSPDYTMEKHTLYQLKSPIHHSEVTFLIQHKKGQDICFVLMLSTEPSFQGNFFVLRDFLVRRVVKTLFDAGIAVIVGEATPNSNPVRTKPDFRHERTADGTPKLVRLYEHLGFSRRTPNSNDLAMTREAFLARLEGSRNRFQGVGGVLAGQTAH